MGPTRGVPESVLQLATRCRAEIAWSRSPAFPRHLCHDDAPSPSPFIGQRQTFRHLLKNMELSDALGTVFAVHHVVAIGTQNRDPSQDPETPAHPPIFAIKASDDAPC